MSCPRSRLRFHVFAQRLPHVEALLASRVAPHNATSFFYGDDVYALVTPRRKVWGANLQKLADASNYVRFYIPLAMRRDMGRANRLGATSADAVKVLYLDTDTLVLRDLAPLYDGVLRDDDAYPSKKNPLAVASGQQHRRVCWFGKMVKVKDDRLMRRRFDAKETCLTASVSFFSVDRWLEQNFTAQVEYWLAENAKKQLWYLGSMPPLMVVLGHSGWERVDADLIYDMKGKYCCPAALHDIWAKAVILHPSKLLAANTPFDLDVARVLKLSDQDLDDLRHGRHKDGATPP